jgi:hypothetical protein
MRSFAYPASFERTYSVSVAKLFNKIKLYGAHDDNSDIDVLCQGIELAEAYICGVVIVFDLITVAVVAVMKVGASIGYSYAVLR